MWTEIVLKCFGVFVAVMALAGPVLAQEDWAASVDCSDPQMQMEITACAQRDWQDQDDRLNAEYKQAMARAKEFDDGLYGPNDGAAAALKAAQKAWLTYRDRSCEAETLPLKGGTAESEALFTCLSVLTATRADELAVFLAE